MFSLLKITQNWLIFVTTNRSTISTRAFDGRIGADKLEWQ